MDFEQLFSQPLVVSQLARTKGGVGGGGWAAGGGLYPLLGLFGLGMCPGMPAIGPNMLSGPKMCLTSTGVNFRPMSSM